MSKNFGKATDLIDFSRSSGGTALRKISYGPELVTNGTFDSDATGTTPATWEANSANASLIKQADGTALFSSTSFGYVRLQNASRPVLPVGVYEVSFNISEWSAGLLNVHVGLDTSGNVVTGNGSYSYLFESTAEQVYEFQLRPNSGGTGSFKIDNISVKEVLFDQADGDLVLFNHPADIPRIEYAADGSVKGLLVEEARTNLLTYSEDFTDASWDRQNTGTLTINAVGPDGKTSAVTLIDSGAGGTGPVTLNETYTVSTSTQYTFSVYMKEDQLYGGYIALANFTTPSGVPYAYFDLQNGVPFSIDAAFDSHSIENVGNGWYRCSVTFTTDVTDTSGQVYIGVANNTNSSWVDQDGTSSILIYGAQFEAGAFPTSYIPTSGATATRSVDVASIDTSAFGYRQGEGTVAVEASSIPVGSGYGNKTLLNLNNGTSNDEISILNDNSDRLRLILDPTGLANDVDFTVVGAEGDEKYIAAWKLNDVNAAHGGILGAGDTSAVPLQTATTMTFSSDANGNGKFSGHIKSIKYYPRRLTNAQLQELTT